MTASLDSWAINAAVRMHPEIITNTQRVVDRISDGKLTHGEITYLTDVVMNTMKVSDAMTLQGVQPTIPLKLTQKQLASVQKVMSNLPNNPVGIKARVHFNYALRSGRIRIIR